MTTNSRQYELRKEPDAFNTAAERHLVSGSNNLLTKFNKPNSDKLAKEIPNQGKVNGVEIAKLSSLQSGNDSFASSPSVLDKQIMN